jgi:hypothetical protein
MRKDTNSTRSFLPIYLDKPRLHQEKPRRLFTICFLPKLFCDKVNKLSICRESRGVCTQAARPHINMGMSQKRILKRHKFGGYCVVSCINVSADPSQPAGEARPRRSVAPGSAGCCFTVARAASASCFLRLTILLLYDPDGHVRDPGL